MSLLHSETRRSKSQYLWILHVDIYYKFVYTARWFSIIFTLREQAGDVYVFAGKQFTNCLYQRVGGRVNRPVRQHL